MRLIKFIFCLLFPVFAFSQTISTIAGNGTAGYSGDGGPATSAEVDTPSGIAIDDSGNVYYSDYKEWVIRKINASTGIITTVAGNRVEGFSGDGGPATLAEFNFPDGIALDGSGNLYIADEMNTRVREVKISTGIITTVAGNGIFGFSGDGGQATSAELDNVVGVFIDTAHNIMYIVDLYNKRVRGVDMGTGIINTAAGSGIYGFSGDGGNAALGDLSSVYGAKTDASGNLFIDDGGNYRIREVDYNTGIINTVAGNGIFGFSGDGGPPLLAEFDYTLDIAIDAFDNLFIADVYNQRIREVNSASGKMETVAGNGIAGFSGDGGPAVLAEFKNPCGLGVDKSGNYYIADYNNSRIREVKICPPPVPANITSANDTLICNGASTVLSVLGSGDIGWYSSDTGGNYLGSGSNFSTGILNSDTVFYVQDSLSCGTSTRTAISIKLLPKPSGKISGNYSICPGQSDSLTASGGTSYFWYNRDTLLSISVSPTVTTQYSVSVSNGGCSDTIAATVFVNPVPLPNLCCDTTIMIGGRAQLNSSGGFTYLWSPNSGLSCDLCSNPIATPSQTTTYYLSLTSDSGCLATDSITITVLCLPVYVCCDTIITHGENVQLSSSGGSSYYWSPETGLSCDSCSNPIATPLQNITYTVTISDSGCISMRTVTIDVSCGSVFIPEAFSPNGAGHNDILFVRGPCISTIDFNVFDRWGNKVFESENLSVGWDGTYKGQPMTTGTYIWYLNATMNDGTKVEKKGNVALVR